MNEVLYKEGERHLAVRRIAEGLYKDSDGETAPWMWDNHVIFVADKTDELADRFGADKEIAVAGALLHDVADVWISRSDDRHDEESKKKARQVLTEAGFSEEEIENIVESVIDPHSCYPDNMPETLEAKVMATADALAHFNTDFYMVMEAMLVKFGINKTPKEYKEWVQKKLERDFNLKIFFDEVREEVREKYEGLKKKYRMGYKGLRGPAL